MREEATAMWRQWSIRGYGLLVGYVALLITAARHLLDYYHQWEYMRCAVASVVRRFTGVSL